MPITIYTAPRLGFRVVSGVHEIGSYVAFSARHFEDPADAYRLIADEGIRLALVRMFPELAAISPATMHHMQPAAPTTAARYLGAMTRDDYNPQDVAAAQRALNYYPIKSAFWDSHAAQEIMQIISLYGLKRSPVAAH